MLYKYTDWNYRITKYKIGDDNGIYYVIATNDNKLAALSCSSIIITEKKEPFTILNKYSLIFYGINWFYQTKKGLFLLCGYQNNQNSEGIAYFQLFDAKKNKTIHTYKSTKSYAIRSNNIQEFSNGKLAIYYTLQEIIIFNPDTLQVETQIALPYKLDGLIQQTFNNDLLMIENMKKKTIEVFDGLSQKKKLTINYGDIKKYQEVLFDNKIGFFLFFMIIMEIKLYI